MNDYSIRKAGLADIPFLADVIIAAEKSNTEKLSFSTLFNIPENKARALIISMLEEEIDGCELSVSSFSVIIHHQQPVAAFGGWIEEMDETLPSKILKANLINYTFGRESMEFVKSKAGIFKDILLERTPKTLQLEYLYIMNAHRGKGLADSLIKQLEQQAVDNYPTLQKAQVQVYTNNDKAIKVYEKNGYKIIQTAKTNNNEILAYLPYNEKCIMEKTFK